jgi:hypothetical protein
MTDIYTALTEAQAEYDAAVARKGRLAAGLNEANAAASSAAGAADKLLADAAGGVDDITDEDLLLSREDARRKSAAAELAAAKHSHGHQQTLPLQLDLLHAKARVVQHEHDSAVDELIEAAGRVDESLGAVYGALASYNSAGQAVFAAYQRAGAFTKEVSAATPDNELLQKARFLGAIPHVNIQPQFGLPKPMVEFFQDLDAGKISARRAPIHSLAELIRAAFNRLMVAA